MEEQNFKEFIERVKGKVDIADVVEKCGFSLKKDGGGNLRAQAPHSLVVSPRYGNYFHYGNEGTRGWTGDAITFVQTYGGRPDFMEALRFVAEMAGERVPEEVNMAVSPAAKAFKLRAEMWEIVCNWLEKQLWETPGALGYARGRGWTDATIRRARLGFTGLPNGEGGAGGGGSREALKKDLRTELQMYEIDVLSPEAVAVLGLQTQRGEQGMRDWCEKYGVVFEDLPASAQKGRLYGLLDFPRLVYPHIERGRVVYFSARNLKAVAGEIALVSDSEHKSWNLPEALVGARPRYYNFEYYRRAESVVLAEGQADGVTWGQWGVACICLAGVGVDEDLKTALTDVERVYLGTDNDEAGRKAVGKLGSLLGPLTRVVVWPQMQGVDANDWLKDMLSSETVAAYDDPEGGIEQSIDDQKALAEAVLGTAEPFILWLTQGLELKSPLRQEYTLKWVVELASQMEPRDYDFYRKDIGEATGKGVAWLDRQIKSIHKEAAEEEKASKEPELEPIFTTGGWIKEHLVEMLYDPAEFETKLAVRFPDGRVEVCDQVKIDGQVYVPIYPNSLIEKHAVRFPSKLGPLMSANDLVTMAQYHILKYFDFGTDDFFAMVSPLYVFFSYLYDGFMELSYLRALGDYGTGKTRFLKTVGLLCYRPIYVTGGSSAASLFRLLDLYKGTLVLNEGDFGSSDESSIIAKIMNGGTERDEAITRVKKTSSGELDLEAFQVYGPKVIATRREFDDRAIASRCLTMEMVPMAPHPRIPHSLPPEFEMEALEIRNAMTTYRMHHAQPDYHVDDSNTDRSIEPRLSQVTLSLMTVIEDEEIKKKIRAFLRDYNEQVRTERYQTQTARVLEGVMRAWAWGPVSEHPSDEWRTYLKDVRECANDIMDEQRAQMGDSDDEDKEKKKKMSSQGIAHILRKYLQLKTIRATDGGDAEYKGTMYVEWDEERIRGLCERWGVEWLERGSLNRPKIVKLQGDPFKDERDLWHEK